jgi:tRNA pseudouridine13 synthase
MPVLRAEPDDFEVDEIPLYPASGAGGHTFVRVEKRDVTTESVARALARAAGVPSSAVGYAGRKDRRALARQWLSVPGLDPERARSLALPGARVLEAVRHPHKLRTGQLAGNAFVLRVRGVDDALAAHARARLDEIVRRGLPNRFGAQRYGRGGDNVERGRALLAGRLRMRDRRAARFLLSALQSAVFDEWLAQRPRAIDEIEAGEVAEVVASGGRFVVEDALREAPRAARFEISATGPIFGLGERSRDPAPAGEPAARERAALATFGLDEAPAARPPGLRLRGTRRPVRARVDEPRFEHAGLVAQLAFRLPPGSYATVLVGELFGAFEEGSGRDDGDGPPGYRSAHAREDPPCPHASPRTSPSSSVTRRWFGSTASRAGFRPRWSRSSRARTRPRA